MKILICSLMRSGGSVLAKSFFSLCFLVACSSTAISQWYALPRIVSDNLTCILSYDTSIIVVIGADGVCLRSLDGGDTWNITDIPGRPALGDAQQFPNGDIIAVGHRAVYGSSDSGVTWRDIYETDNPNQTWYNGLRSVAVINDSLVWSIAGNGLFRSKNAGRTWEYVPTSTYGLRGMDWVGDSLGFIVGQSGLIMRTKDGGSSWEKVGRGLTNSYLQEAYFINADSGVVTGGHYDGVILTTTNGGDSWKVVLEQSYGRIWNVSYSGEQWWVTTSDAP